MTDTANRAGEAAVLGRDWMVTRPRGPGPPGRPVLAAASSPGVVFTSGSTRHRLVVLDWSSGDPLYQVPVDMLVDHILVEAGLVILVNANNLLLSVVLDFN